MREVTPVGYAGVAGNHGDDGEFTVVTVWDGLKNIVAFAGPDPGKQSAVRG